MNEFGSAGSDEMDEMCEMYMMYIGVWTVINGNLTPSRRGIRPTSGRFYVKLDSAPPSD